MGKSRRSRTRAYEAEAYQLLFAEVADDQARERLIGGRNEITGYRTWSVKAGDTVYVKAYPLWNTQALRAKAKEEAERLRQLAAQAKLNDRKAAEEVAILANTNFTGRDVVLHPTIEGESPTMEQARKHLRNYFARVKTWRRRHGYTDPLKYLYVIEYTDEEGGTKRLHYHIMMSGMDRDEAERLWQWGERVNCDRLKPEAYEGLDALSHYILKAQRGKRHEKRWGCSQNLIRPEPKRSDRKITRRKAEQLALGFEEVSRKVLERAFPGYRLIECEVRTSKYVSGAYITARMRRKGEADEGESHGTNTHRKRGADRAVSLGAAAGGSAAGAAAVAPHTQRRQAKQDRGRAF